MQFKFLWACFALLSVLIQGCPSSGSSTTPLGGVAAVGAPLAGAEVILVDAAGTTKTATADAEGAYTFDDVGAMTAPFLLKATGTVGGEEQTMYSALDEKPTPGETAVLNATPMTNAVVTQASGGDPAALFANPKGLDATAMKDAKEKILVVLADQMKEQGLDPTKFDPFKTPFRANSSGFDKMLDLVKIQADSSGQMKLTDKATGVETAIKKNDDLSAMANKVMPKPDPAFASMDFSKIKTLVAGINTLMAADNPSTKDFERFVHANFLTNGKNFNDFTQMVSEAKGTKLTGFVFGSCDPKELICDGTISLVQPDGIIKQEGLPVKYVDGGWKFYGNQRKVGFDLDPNILIDVKVTFDIQTNSYQPTTSVTQGFELRIENTESVYLSAELVMDIKAKDGQITSKPVASFENNPNCYQLVLSPPVKSESDDCDHFLSYKELEALTTISLNDINTAYSEGRLKFKLNNVVTTAPDKFDVPPFRPVWVSVNENDSNFKKMLETKFKTNELGSTSVTLPKGLDLEWVGFYLYNDKQAQNTAEGIYFGSESLKLLGDTITSEEICDASNKQSKSMTNCNKTDIITSIRWRFRDPLGSDLRITFGYYFPPPEYQKN